MGARSKNFYNDLAKRMGYEAAAATIQDHYLAGRRKEAEAAVPDALIDETSLVGPKERVRERLQAWLAIGRDHRVGSLVLAGADISALRIVLPRQCFESGGRCLRAAGRALKEVE
jgi:alkanesulfonate monooxygenase SsuD/methylene tetrahydromethanopterin reductase-like flavin-dependent oxidoreductase (luciferase family)